MLYGKDYDLNMCIGRLLGHPSCII